MGNLQTDQKGVGGGIKASWEEAVPGSGQSSFSGVRPEFESQLRRFVAVGSPTGYMTSPSLRVAHLENENKHNVSHKELP